MSIFCWRSHYTHSMTNRGWVTQLDPPSFWQSCQQKVSDTPHFSTKMSHSTPPDDQQRVGRPTHSSAQYSTYHLINSWQALLYSCAKSIWINLDHFWPGRSEKTLSYFPIVKNSDTISWNIQQRVSDAPHLNLISSHDQQNVSYGSAFFYLSK